MMAREYFNVMASGDERFLDITIAPIICAA